MARWLPWAGLAVRLAGAAIWLFAGITKLTDLDGFRLQVHAYQILPSGIETAFSYALPLVEIVLGLYLLVGALVRPVAIVSCVLMAWRVSGLHPVPAVTLSSHRGPRLAYAVPVFAGLMVTLWLK